MLLNHHTMKLTAFCLIVYTACIMFLAVHFTRTFDRAILADNL